MVTVSASPEEAADLIGRWAERLSVAVLNGPASTVVGGDPEALDELLTHCEAAGVWARRVPVDYASHSPHMAALRDELTDALASVTPRTPRIAFHSTVEGVRHEPFRTDGAYWYENLRRQVEFFRLDEREAVAVAAAVEEVAPRVVRMAQPQPRPAVRAERAVAAVAAGGWTDF